MWNFYVTYEVLEFLVLDLKSTIDVFLGQSPSWYRQGIEGTK